MSSLGSTGEHRWWHPAGPSPPWGAWQPSHWGAIGFPSERLPPRAGAEAPPGARWWWDGSPAHPSPLRQAPGSSSGSASSCQVPLAQGHKASAFSVTEAELSEPQEARPGFWALWLVPPWQPLVRLANSPAQLLSTASWVWPPFPRLLCPFKPPWPHTCSPALTCLRGGRRQE